MVLENIYRHREHGEGKVKAASIGAREITFAAAATTAAIVAIFLPVAFMKGIIGKFFFQFGVTISVAVLISLLEALTLAPMRCSQFLEVGERQGRLGPAVDRLFKRLSAGYSKALQPALRHRVAILAGATAAFFASLFIVKALRWEFVPSQDTNFFLARIQTPVGSSLDATDRAFQQAEGFLRSRPEVERYFGVIGVQHLHADFTAREAVIVAEADLRPGDRYIDQFWKLPDGRIVGYEELAQIDPASMTSETGPTYPIVYEVIPAERYREVEARGALILGSIGITMLVGAGLIVTRRRPG
jgi:multidrug efflux pump subunit AcrB